MEAFISTSSTSPNPIFVHLHTEPLAPSLAFAFNLGYRTPEECPDGVWRLVNLGTLASQAVKNILVP